MITKPTPREYVVSIAEQHEPSGYISLSELCEKLGITRAGFGKLEYAYPGATIGKKIYEVYGLTKQDIMNNSEPNQDMPDYLKPRKRK